MKHTLIRAGLLLVLAGGMAGPALSAGPNAQLEGRPGYEQGGDGQRSEAMLRRMAKILDLSQEQQQRIQALHDAERSRVEPLRRSLREDREKLHAALDAQPFDEATVRRLAAAIAANRTELLVSRAKVKAQTQALLTPEQAALAEKLRPLREHRREHAPGPKEDEGL